MHSRVRNHPERRPPGPGRRPAQIVTVDGHDRRSRAPTVTFDQVLLVEKDGGEVLAGAPFVADARVVGVVDGETRGPKIRVFKKKRRKGMRRTKGHRSAYTRVRIKTSSPSCSHQPSRQHLEDRRTSWLTKKGQGSSRNGRDSNSQRLGVKRFDGNLVTGGSILVRQRGRRFQAGPERRASARTTRCSRRSPGAVKFEDHGAQGRVISVHPLGVAREGHCRDWSLKRSRQLTDSCSSTKSTSTSRPGTAGAAASASAARSSSRAAARTAATAATAARSSSSPARTTTPSSPSASIPSSRAAARRPRRGLATAPAADGHDLRPRRCPSARSAYETTRRAGEPLVLLADLTEAGRARARRQGRPRRARQRPLRHVHQPRAAQGAARRARRGARSAPDAEAARRRRARRLPQRRQVHADRAHLGGAAEDRRLPVHDADAAPRRRAAQRRPQLRRRRRARAHRRARTAGTGSGTSSCGTSSGRRCSCTSSTCRGVGPRSGRGLRHRPRASSSSFRRRDARPQAAAGRRQQDRRGRRAGRGASAPPRGARDAMLGLPFYAISA